MRVTVVSMGAHLRLQNGLLVIEQKDCQKTKYPVRKISELVIEANVSVTSALMCTLAESGANVVFCTPNGWPRARIDPFSGGKQALLRKKQMLASLTEAGFYLAGRFASAKAAQQLALLEALRMPKLSQARGKIVGAMKLLANARTREELMGLEGLLSRMYFDCLRSAFGEEWGFEKREHKPANDPINAMLSYGYGVLYTKTMHAVASAGLDPYVGFYHADKYGRKSLVYDAAEPFKPAIVDRSVVTLVRHRQLSVDDFEAKESGLPQKAKRELIGQIEKRLEDRKRFGGSAFTYKAHIEKQAQRLKAYLLGDAKEFIPFGIFG